MQTIVRFLICLLAFGLCLYSYLDRQNEVTHLRIQIPDLAKKIQHLKEENMRLKYEIDQFESPIHLMELARQPAYSHLKFPLAHQVLLVGEGLALQSSSEPTEVPPRHAPRVTLAAKNLK